jgi:hypothetical protein
MPVRPTQVYQEKRDRAIKPTPAGRRVVIGFRVRYRLPGDPGNLDRVTPLLWEHEATKFADDIAGIPGLVLAERPDRPRGIEPVWGFDTTSSRSAPGLDRWWWWKRKARHYAGLYRDAQEACAARGPIDDRYAHVPGDILSAYLTDVLERVPVSARPIVHHEFTTAATGQ